MVHSNSTKILLYIIAKQFVKIQARGTWHKSNNARSSFFGLIGLFKLSQIQRFWWWRGREEGWQHFTPGCEIFFFLFPIRWNVDSISHLFVNFSTNSSFCQSALGMGLYTEGHHSEWLHSQFSVFRSLSREFYIAIFWRSDTQSKFLMLANMSGWLAFHVYLLRATHTARKTTLILDIFGSLPGFCSAEIGDFSASFASPPIPDLTSIVSRKICPCFQAVLTSCKPCSRRIKESHINVTPHFCKCLIGYL